MSDDSDDIAQLARKLSEIYEEVKYVEKRGVNTHHGYKYAQEEDIVTKIRQALADRKVVVLPATEAVTREGDLTTAKMSYTFIDGETGAQITKSWFGTGQDKQDKGLYKAYTGSVKYFLLKTFLLPTGNDPERVQESQSNGRNKKQSSGRGDVHWSAVDYSDEPKRGGDEDWQNASKRYFAVAGDGDCGELSNEFRDFIKDRHSVDSWKQIPPKVIHKWCDKVLKKHSAEPRQTDDGEAPSARWDAMREKLDKWNQTREEA